MTPWLDFPVAPTNTCMHEGMYIWVYKYLYTIYEYMYAWRYVYMSI
jgi:hypothetical protein